MVGTYTLIAGTRQGQRPVEHHAHRAGGGLASLEELVRASPRTTNVGAFGFAYGRAGRVEDAKRVASQIARQSEGKGGIAYYEAEVSAGLGDRETTLKLTAEERARLVTLP